VGDRLFRTAASMIPQAGMNGMVTVAPMIVSTIFLNVGISIDTSNIVDSLPGRDTISNMVIQNSVDTVILTRETVKITPFSPSLAIKVIKRVIKTLRSMSAGIVNQITE